MQEVTKHEGLWRRTFLTTLVVGVLTLILSLTGDSSNGTEQTVQQTDSVSITMTVETYNRWIAEIDTAANLIRKSHCLPGDEAITTYGSIMDVRINLYSALVAAVNRKQGAAAGAVGTGSDTGKPPPKKK